MRVLLAEDEPIIRMDVRRLLEELGCQVVGECRDGNTAVKLTMKLCPDVVLMDIKMPGTDGLAATRLIHKKLLAPVVLLTSYSDAETVLEATESGALCYLVKPVEKEKLGPALKVARQRFLEIKKLHSEVGKLSVAVADREVITRAKTTLQEKLHCKEQDAFNQMRKRSMDQHRKISAVAREIVEKEDK